jgi:pimeloyl-ACP methyl ester carboxylesterase
VQRLTVEANGLRFGALAWGEEDAPLALLVHGYPDTAWTWRHVGPALAERGWRAVAPFTRGYAPTGPAPDDRYFAADLADDLAALHGALGGDGRAVLVGHDWGAVALWTLSARADQPFARLAALAVPPPVELFRPWSAPRTLPLALRQTPRLWYFLANQVPRLAERAQDQVTARLWRSWSPGHDPAEDLAHLAEALPDDAHRRAAVRYYRNNLRSGLPQVLRLRPQAPALYLHGEDDGCMTVELAREAAGRLPEGSRFVTVPGAGHFLQLERPDEVLEHLDAWLGTG